MATCSSIFTREIPRTEEPDGLQFIRPKRVGNNSMPTTETTPVISSASKNAANRGDITTCGMSTVPASAHCSRVFSVHSSLSPRRNTLCACPLASGRHRLVLFLLSYSHSEVFCSPSYPASSRCSSGQKPSLAELPPSSQTSSPNDESSE